MLALARILTLFPMRIYSRACGTARRETPRDPPQEQIETARRLACDVHRAAVVVPFKAVCIEQTIAARLMLRLRGVPATTYIGVHRDPAQRIDPRGYNSHAWLRIGDRVVIGGPDVSGYVPLAMFV